MIGRVLVGDRQVVEGKGAAKSMVEIQNLNSTFGGRSFAFAFLKVHSFVRRQNAIDRNIPHRKSHINSKD